MTTMASITVKAADGTTDVVYQPSNPSGGDGTKALWQATAVGTQYNQFPWMTMMSANSKDGRSRHIRLAYSYPMTVTNSTTGLISVVNQTPWEVLFTRPNSITGAVVNESVHQFTNLLVSTLVRQSVAGGFAPQ